MTRTLLLWIGLWTISSSQLVAQENSEQGSTTRRKSDWRLAPKLSSVQGEYVTAIFSGSFGGSVDVDFFRDVASQQMGAGLRVGLERIGRGGFGGEQAGSPYWQYDVLLRTSLLSTQRYFRIDLYLGGTYHDPTAGFGVMSRQVMLKGGIDIRLRLSTYPVGLMLKFEKSKAIDNGGLGLYFGFDGF